MKGKLKHILIDARKGDKDIDKLLDELCDLCDVSKSFSWEEVREFGRSAFYSGREIERYNDNGEAIFKRPTYNGYIREIDEY